jgi:trimethylamine--corrinoid protein Co-methyltransferase
MIKGFTRRFKPLDLLRPEEVEAIHRGALYTLQKTGMRIEHEGALELYRDRGCQVDLSERRVRIPPAIVEECIRQCPSSYLLKARDREQDLMLGGNTFYFMQGMGMRYLDLDTWETRPATADEHREAMIVADALDNVHLADAIFFYMERQHIPSVMVMLENLASGLRHCSKAQQFGYMKDSSIFAIKMAEALGMNLNPELDSAAPLTLYADAVEAAFRYVKAGIPIQPTVGMSMGAEGPATNAAALTLAVAMVMGWTVLTQSIKPGAPMSIQFGLRPMDMKTGTPRFGAVGYSLNSATMNQMLRHYQIPSCPGAGFTSTSKKIDYQVGYEKSLGALINALSGAHLQIFQGGSSGELLYHPVLSILDNDVAGWVGRFIQGVSVTDETMAVDLINQVGPIPGHYLSTAHTREWWRVEQYLPQVADLTPYPVWVQEGKRDALQLAKEKMAEILASHRPLPLSPEQEQAVANILEEARTYYRDRDMISDEEWTDYRPFLHPTG